MYSPQFSNRLGTSGLATTETREVSPINRYYRDPKLLDVIVKAGDSLIENMDGKGQWIFFKKDGSTWGRIWMPWTYSRWIRTYRLVRDDLPPDSRRAWTEALTLGYTGISQRCLGHVHNIFVEVFK